MSQTGFPSNTNNNNNNNGSNNSNANAMSSSLAAENYQLKWNSHVTNLNSSICSLYKNDKYADVMLLTCNIDEGSYGIPAHKVILGTCSHYFASIFDNNPMPINGMIFIVLPPELSRRAIGTLLQYMYMGEATVANDILNEVLKGGEVLKIRGLCKIQNEIFNSKFETTTTTTLNQQPSNYHQQQFNSTTASPLKSNKSTPRNSIERKSSLDMKNNGNASNNSLPHVLTQQSQESPVVMSTNLNSQQAQQSAASAAVINNNNNHQHHHQSTSSTTIIVKKDMAIDPGDSNNIPVEHYGLISLKIAAAVKKAQQQSSISSMKKSPMSANVEHHHQSRGGVEFYPLNERDQQFESPPPFKVYTTSSSSSSNESNFQQQIQEDILRYTEKKKRMAENQRPTSSSTTTLLKSVDRIPENGQQFHSDEQQREKLPQFPEALSFLTIKEEPLEWSDMEAQVEGKNEQQQPLVNVKPESTMDEIDHQPTPQDNVKTYSPLTCELCNLKFQVPAAWVRHIESHSEVNIAQQNLPKKRKRTEEHEENAENINILSCDLCENIQFATPGDWVRHVQNTHTESELAISNNSILMKKNVKSTKENSGEKACSVCKKMFPSYASMLIHKRTHNAEKSFVCPQCNKGFNVKSNLLRHMRSCHNQIPSNDESDGMD